MKKWQIAVGLLLVFAIGMAAGTYGSRMILKKRIDRMLHTNGPPGVWAIQRMVRRLDLSKSQEASIKAILDTNKKKWETLRQKYEPQIKELFDTVISETKKVLTPQQRVEIERMSAGIRRRLPPRSSSPLHAPSRPGSMQGAASPPPMAQHFAPKPEADKYADMVKRLGISGQKSAEVRAILQAGLKHQAVIADRFRKSRDQAAAAYRKALADARAAMEQKLQPLLTPEQMAVFKRLAGHDGAHHGMFGLDDTPMDTGAGGQMGAR